MNINNIIQNNKNNVKTPKIGERRLDNLNEDNKRI